MRSVIVTGGSRGLGLGIVVIAVAPGLVDTENDRDMKGEQREPWQIRGSMTHGNQVRAGIYRNCSSYLRPERNPAGLEEAKSNGRQ
jgi:NAD(P)-dependent dehydrogenase (short-subunit alcohol dehydrogenase family)